MKSKKCKVALITALAVVLSFFLIINPIASVIVYESIFSSRYETAEWTKFYLSDFPGLAAELCEITTDDETALAGYHYSRAEGKSAPQGLVVISHGLGGGGHNAYMPFIDFFAKNGYLVFAYDATGCDASGGEDVEGLPQGVKDLDTVLRYVGGCEAYRDLPVFLFGHSWGAYSAGCVLESHPEVKAAVLISGFDRSKDMILQQGKEIVGEVATVLSPSVLLYERCKFGAWAERSVTESIQNSEASVLIVHSKDDMTVLPENGYDRYYEVFRDVSRVSFQLYEDRGHSYLFYSDAAQEYRDKLNADYLAYVDSHGGVHSAEIKIEFMRDHLDKAACFEPDPDLMAQILSLYSSTSSDGN